MSTFRGPEPVTLDFRQERRLLCRLRSIGLRLRQTSCSSRRFRVAASKSRSPAGGRCGPMVYQPQSAEAGASSTIRNGVVRSLQWVRGAEAMTRQLSRPAACSSSAATCSGLCYDGFQRQPAGGNQATGWIARRAVPTIPRGPTVRTSRAWSSRYSHRTGGESAPRHVQVGFRMDRDAIVEHNQLVAAGRKAFMAVLPEGRGDSARRLWESSSRVRCSTSKRFRSFGSPQCHAVCVPTAYPHGLLVTRYSERAWGRRPPYARRPMSAMSSGISALAVASSSRLAYLQRQGNRTRTYCTPFRVGSRTAPWRASASRDNK